MQIKQVVVGVLETNTYLISSKTEGIIVDPGGEANKILSLTKGISIKCILLTHNHWDHTDAVKEIKKNTGIKCGVHLLDKTDSMFDFEIVENTIIKIGEASLKVIHTPGHTQGSCCFLVQEHKDEALLSGDTIFCGGFGRTDLPGGSDDELFKSIEKIMKLSPNIIVYPGHGPTTKVSEIQLF